MACNRPPSAENNIPKEGVADQTAAVKSEKLDVPTFRQKIEVLAATGNVQLIDVRTPQEFGEGAIDGAINHNVHDADFQQQLEQYDKTKPILVYCKSGGRSAQAAETCENAGFKEIYDLSGGYTAWNKQ